ncbi:DNA/RNA non-specific endonuclease [Peptoanaerobacter stomatis]|uniref:DNA/RNA non-specific endonuclease n=1 Tax=Peptoanaerobacter stomatis TaxID=796937 RepID=J5UCS0_9FIRM|nr:DNA/RNA non-specific endonuclease [Peptoanaerobacter stomatis]EJU21549.1 DNA/RNA non-specific endonuclease [Peptoanaerobacter stomatis]NWO24687.1 DNA/RNA non-specific endonuclease [Peptostreptococcaceae bacterium oral taxon 081]
MLRGIIEQKEISKERFEAKQDQIQKQALKRFIENDSKRNSNLEKIDIKDNTLKSRRKLLNDYDSIAMERIMGKSDLFPISYLQMGTNSGNSICRIQIRDDRGSFIGSGTGFLVSENVLMTNNHVIDSMRTALNSIAEFNYQDDVNFMPCPTCTFRLNPEQFFVTDEELDFTLVALKDNPSSDKQPKDFGHLHLVAEEGKILEGEYVSIIQHPNGGPKAVTIRENKVSSILDDFIHYLTDTEPGSSGSPVFNDQWIVVALHHSGVPNPNKKNTWIANEGIRISSISNYFAKKYNNFTAEEKMFIGEIFSNLDIFSEPNPSDPIPSQIDVGYDSTFLGLDYKVDLPGLSEEMKKDVSYMDNGSYVLDYTHFSIVMCRSRCLAYFTAVNIDGNQAKNIKRSGDSWNFDPRIPTDAQYGDELYAKNDLDRGHLVRRLDPVWGDKAIQANNDTFHFTNSSPQHKNLNQKIWLDLENYILKNAQNHNLKVSVFTGPVFRSDDMIYRGKFKIPAEFWKVAVMIKDDGKMSATAYLQTQKNMIENLEFAYGEYKTYQVPVARIEEITGLDFGELSQYDPIANIESAGMVIGAPEHIKL